MSEERGRRMSRLQCNLRNGADTDKSYLEYVLVHMIKDQINSF